MRRFGVAATTAMLALAGAFGLTGCGAAGGAAQEAAIDVAAGMGVEGQALAALGFDPQDITPTGAGAVPGASSSGEPTDQKGQRRDGWRKRHAARVLLRKNMLHGEAVVQTKEGTKTVVVQRGTVTAIDGTTMTVKSADGFTTTWTFGDKLNVVERRTSVQPDQVKVGTVLGVAGAKDGDRTVARLIVIPKAQ